MSRSAEDATTKQTETDPVHLRIENIHKSYDGHHVLRGVSFDVLRGKINIIIGPSGSGKTVLMKQIIRLESPDSGKILVDSDDIVPLNEYQLVHVRRKFGMVFQLAALFDSMTVFENVAFMLREHTKMKNKEIEEHVMSRLTALGVDAARDKIPAELSGGMQKRVAVARALVINPEILIYDEPTTGLDPVMARTVDDLIEETAEQFGVTSIVISHDMVQVFQIADVVNFLYNGQIEEAGSPEDIVSSQNPTTMSFLAASGVNPTAVMAEFRNK